MRAVVMMISYRDCPGRGPERASHRDPSQGEGLILHSDILAPSGPVGVVTPLVLFVVEFPGIMCSCGLQR